MLSNQWIYHDTGTERCEHIFLGRILSLLLSFTNLLLWISKWPNASNLFFYVACNCKIVLIFTDIGNNTWIQFLVWYISQICHFRCLFKTIYTVHMCAVFTSSLANTSQVNICPVWPFDPHIAISAYLQRFMSKTANSAPTVRLLHFIMWLQSFWYWQ